MRTGGAGDRTTDLQVSGRPTLGPDLGLGRPVNPISIEPIDLNSHYGCIHSEAFCLHTQKTVHEMVHESL